MSGAQTALAEAVLSALRECPDLQAAFGDPARIFDQRPSRSPFPFIELGRHEARSVDASSSTRWDHRLTINVVSRAGGRLEAKRLLGLVEHALRTEPLNPIGWHVVTRFPAYADVFEGNQNTIFRGLIRLRAILEKDEI